MSVEAARKRYLRHKNAGICVSCTKKAIKGKVRCKACYKKQLDRQRAKAPSAPLPPLSKFLLDLALKAKPALQPL